MKRNPFLRDWKLMWQIGILFFAFMLVASLVNMALVYKNCMEMLLKERTESYFNLAKYAAKRLEDERNIKWLFSYWQENCDEMDITYDEPEAIPAAFENFFQKNPNVDLDTINEAVIEKLTAENQKLYAEAKYMQVLNDFNEMKRVYKPLYLSACSYVSDVDLFYFLSASNPGEKRSKKQGRDAYMLGAIHNITNTPQPLRKKTWETGVFQYELGSMERGYYHAYAPAVTTDDDGNKKTLCVIDVVLEVNTVRKQLVREVFRVEIFSIIGFVFSAIVLFLLLRAVIIKPISSLQSVIAQYQIDKDHKAVATNLKKYFGKNEMGLLSFDFSSLAMAMNEYTENIAKLAADKERIGTELSIATKIQASILPSVFPPFPDRHEFDIFASMTPAKEVGGDFYDFFMVDDDHIALVIADVSGKGVPAALFMMAAKTVIKAQVLSGSGATEALSIANNTLSENNAAEMFVSVWLGIYEISTGVMRCANAGHEFPAIKTSQPTDENVAGKFELFKDKHGFVLAGMPGMKYKEYELSLGAGDVVFVYTDGVPEATDKDNNLFGTDRMIEALNDVADKESSENDSPEAILARVKKHVDDFVGNAEQFDDLTMLAFKINGGTCHHEITLPATIENIASVTTFIDTELEKAECPLKAQSQIDIAIDEIFSNIAKFAYGEGEGDATVKIAISETDAKKIAEITFIDSGDAFNPLEKADPDTTLSAEDREIGGLGIFMVKKSMDSVEYERKDEKNIFTIKKSLIS